jgi:hypothetical protein
MISQSALMVLARVERKSADGLKALLSTMNLAPGKVDSAHTLVPFERLENLHFSRFVILDDQTVGDVREYNLPPQEYPLYLAFLCDFDGPMEAFLTDLLQHAEAGLRQIFSFSSDFTPGADLRQWLRDHNIPIATNYVNWRGRTAQQVREESRLRQTICKYLVSNQAALAGKSAAQIRADVRRFRDAEIVAGRLTLTPSPPTPFGEWIANAVHFLGVGFLIALLLPLFALMVVFVIRSREKTDPQFAPPPDAGAASQLALIEDNVITNQFTAMGSLKPGLARRWLLRYILWLIEWTARHLYTKGRLARVRTIHFARWVFLDGNKRILFCSNYDGSLDSYMDDFINKVGFGLNVVFSNGIGYPSTRWLLCDGSQDEQKFKYFLRRHQLPTQVWYDAYSGVNAVELEWNSRVRQGLEASSVSEQEAREWVQLL